MATKDIRKILAYLAIKHKGDWEKIYEDIKAKVCPSYDEIERCTNELKTPFITLMDPEYPQCLKDTYRPPFVLFYYGDISLIQDMKKTLSVVGCRENTAYGKKMTQDIISVVAKEYIIVSGMARGIDSLAHISAIQSGGKTIAVLGSGIDYCYPHENKELYETIKKNHLVISEYPNNVTPDSSHFPIRNRIIAALGGTLLIIEAKRSSGTSITAKLALEQNKDILCVPTKADENSLCNYYISQGAYLVETGEDVLKHLKSLV